MHSVLDELETYGQKSCHKSVLLFPPLPSRLRYLIHKTVEDRPELSTFSVGESWCRRVVVCHSELRGESEVDSDVENTSCLCEEYQSGRVEMENNIKPKSSVPSRSRGPKRPDQPLYMPRAARQRLSLKGSQSPTANTSAALRDTESPGSPSSPCPCCDAMEKTTCSSSSEQEASIGVADGDVDASADGSPPCPPEETQMLELRLSDREGQMWEQTQSRFTEMNLDDEKEEVASVQDDTSTDTDDLTELIKAHLKQAEVFLIEHAHNDFSIYESVSLISDDFRHVIEIYDFPAALKTENLLEAFAEYSDGGMKITWVDDTHALGVFSSEAAAVHALSICNPRLKVRALSEGSKKAQGKALRRAEFIQPVKERPRTDCAVARRMVTRALGIRGRARAQRY
ncbi:R3H and coiled-coil domain-containing protein 1 [Menidia menidia]